MLPLTFEPAPGGKRHAERWQSTQGARTASQQAAKVWLAGEEEGLCESQPVHHRCHLTSPVETARSRLPQKREQVKATGGESGLQES